MMKLLVRVLITAALLSGVFVFLCGISSCKDSISGTVKGDGAQDVVMELSGDASLNTKTSVNGNYTFKGLEKGSYTITPGKEGYLFFPKSREVQVDGDMSEMDVEDVSRDETYNTHNVSVGVMYGPSAPSIRTSYTRRARF